MNKLQNLCISILTLIHFTYVAANEENVKKAMQQNKIKQYCKRKTATPNNSLSNLSSGARFLLGEIAMYNADRLLKTNMVPTTIIKKETNGNHSFIQVCSKYITPNETTIKDDQHLKSLVTPNEYATMKILYFLFGQYDRHRGNKVIEKNTGKLFLIDNEAIANTSQYVQGYSPDKTISCPWIPLARLSKTPNIKQEKTLEDTVAINQVTKKILSTFPEGPLKKRIEEIKNKNTNALLKIFSSFDKWTKRDISRNNCVLWNNILWRQMYVSENYIGAPFSAYISPSLHESISKLSKKDLISLWPKPPVNLTGNAIKQYEQLKNSFADQTLRRKQMVLDYFKENPKNIKKLNSKKQN